MSRPALSDLFDVAIKAAYLAGRCTLGYFNTHVAVQTRPDTTPASAAKQSDAYQRLADRVKLNRTRGDAYGYVLVAMGRAKIMLDPVIKPWDIAPMLPILGEAGGRFTDWQGNATIWHPAAAATNGLLHEQVLAVLGSEKRG